MFTFFYKKRNFIKKSEKKMSTNYNITKLQEKNDQSVGQDNLQQQRNYKEIQFLNIEKIG